LKLYEHACPNKYEEIKTWYPVWYSEIFEMDALWQVFGKQMDDIQTGIISAVNNNFNFVDSKNKIDDFEDEEIDNQYPDIKTIPKLEAFLGISYDTQRTLSERRNTVKAFFSGFGHLGEKKIIDMLSGYCTGGEINVNFFDGTIHVIFFQSISIRFYECFLTLLRRLPAHLTLELTDSKSCDCELTIFVASYGSVSYESETIIDITERNNISAEEYIYIGGVPVITENLTVSTRLL
jgi:hypothetical protein